MTMKKALSDILDITVALIQTVAILSSAKIAAMSKRRKAAMAICALLLALTAGRLIASGTVGGEAILLLTSVTYLYATRPGPSGEGDETR